MARLDFESLVLPGVALAALVGIYFFKDQLAEAIGKIGDLIPNIGNGDTNGDTNGDGNGDGDGDGNGGTTCVKKTCQTGQIWSQSQCKCIKKTSSGEDPEPPPPASGTQWYKANGATTTLSKGRQDGESNRWNKNVTGWSNGFEVMGYLTVTGMQSGSHIGLKMAGPNHSGNCGHKEGGSCCCWWDGGLRRNGTSYLEIEYPHPTNKNEKMFNKMGRNIDAGVLGVRWYNAKEGSKRRIKFWVDTDGKANAHKWRLMYDVLDSGQFMPTSYYTKIPNEIELEIRISDVSPGNIKWHTGPVGRQIRSTSNLAYAYNTEDINRITLA